VIHIAGTNGKGSTQAMIRAGLEASAAIASTPIPRRTLRGSTNASGWRAS
jgi:UDP-N-acetylmuramyl tripeptide synthase